MTVTPISFHGMVIILKLTLTVVGHLWTPNFFMCCDDLP